MKKKKIVIPIIIICSLILIGGIAFAVTYFFTDIFKSNKDMFFKYISQYAEVGEILKSDTLDAYIEKQKNTPYTSEGYVKTNVTFSDNSKADIANALQNCSITVSGTSDPINKYGFYNISANYSDSQKIVFEAVKKDDVCALKIDEVTGERFIGIQNNNLKDLFRKLGASEETIKDIPDKIDFSQMQNEQELFTDEELEELKNRYSKVLTENIKDDMFSKESSGEENTYVLSIDEKTASSIFLRFLENIKDDQLLINKFKQIMLTNANIPETEVDETITNFQNLIQSLIKRFTAQENNDLTTQNENEKNSRKTFIKVKVCEKDKKLTKTELSIESQNDETATEEMTEMQMILRDHFPKYFIEKYDTGIGLGIETNGKQNKIIFQKNEALANVEYKISGVAENETMFEFSVNYEGLNTDMVKETAEFMMNTDDFSSLIRDEYNSINGYNENDNNTSKTKIVCTYSNQKNFGPVNVEQISNNNILLLNTAPNRERIVSLMESVGQKINEVNYEKMSAAGIDEYNSPFTYYLPAIIPVGELYFINSGDYVTPLVIGALGGSSIAMISEDNAILSRAAEAKRITEIAEEKEMIGLAVTEAVTDMYREMYVNNSRESAKLTIQDIEKYLDSNKFRVTKNLDNTFTITSTSTGNQYICDENGKVDFGKGTTYNNYNSSINSNINTSNIYSNGSDILSSSRSAINNNVDLTAREASVFNIRFESYAGSNKSATNINTLAFSIRNSNSTNREHQITINGQNATLFQNIDSSKKYSVMFEYDDKGFICNALIN